MSLLGNILWFFLGGFFASLGYLVAGLGLCLTIIGIPFGVQSFKLAFAVLAPFGKEVRAGDRAASPLRIIFNIVWVLLFGWELALNHLFWAFVFAITIIGLPFAVQHLKLIPLALFPFGHDFVDN